jgi:hypothetical protein
MLDCMARGWESKGVEAQQAERDQPQEKDRADSPPTPEEIARLDRLRTLELARARAAADLARATHPSHRAMLEAALKAIDEQLRGST